MLNRRPSPRLRRHRPGVHASQRGIGLLEALVSIVILAVAVLGMLGVQLRTLAETQTAVRRAQAVRLIEDFAERIKTNPARFAQLNTYVSPFDAVPVIATDCKNSICDAASLAAWDLAEWKQAVAETLPKGNASIFVSTDEQDGTRRQLGVIVAWRRNEGSTDADYLAPFRPSNAPDALACPADLICHLVYVQP